MRTFFSEMAAMSWTEMHVGQFGVAGSVRRAFKKSKVGLLSHTRMQFTHRFPAQISTNSAHYQVHGCFMVLCLIVSVIIVDSAVGMVVFGILGASDDQCS